MNEPTNIQSVARPSLRSRLGSLAAFALPLIAVVGWGGSFPVAKAALPSVNAFYLTSARYVFAALIFVAILWTVEGRDALRFDGHLLRVFLLGSVGIGGFGLLAFLGLTHSRPENAALLVATMPLLTALVLWVQRGTRPSRATIGFMTLALIGVSLVITRGSLSLLTSGQVGAADGVVLLGVLCWVTYSLGTSSLPGWSPLRYTTLSAVTGSATLVIATCVATAVGYVSLPDLHAALGVAWQIGYMALPGTTTAVLAWNAGIKRLGAQNTVLFINLVPLITLAIEAARGYQVLGVELTGVALTILALSANNLWQRRGAAHSTPDRKPGQSAAA